MIVLLIGGIISLGAMIFYFWLRKAFRISLQKDTARRRENIRRIRQEIAKDKHPAELPREEDILDISEESNEARGIESSAVMDAEDEEDEG